MQKISILGSTGSIGKSALSLVDHYPERLQVQALAAHSDVETLYRQCLKYRPELVALYDESAARELSSRLSGIRVLSGLEGIVETAAHGNSDTVLSSISGVAGLVPTYHAVKEGKKVALANKEALVSAGDVLLPVAREKGAELIPVDSEHSALHQCLRASAGNDVKRLVLTASGGPFLGKSRKELETVSVEEALDHPTWEMGKKITIDSATLMNKGLEVIEAHHFFHAPAEQISVVIHPQSIVHSMVEFVDGTILAQLSITDMRCSLLYAFGYPDRWASRLPRLDLSSLGSLRFEEPDTDRFPCLSLAYEALRRGGSYPAVLNAANETAVHHFLSGRVAFLEIPEVIDRTLQGHAPQEIADLETVLEVDRQARREAEQIAAGLAQLRAH